MFATGLGGLAALALFGCAPAQTPRATAADGLVMDCASPVSYDGKDISGDVALAHIFGGSGEVSDTATREPNPVVEKYFAALTQLCRQYNAGVLDGPAYRDRADGLTQSLLGDLAPTGQQKSVFAEVYPQLLPQAAVRAPFQIEFSMSAVVAGGSPQVVRPNQPLPTCASVRFEVSVDQPVHVYLMQKTARQGLTALFPHSQITTAQNPLTPGNAYQLPPEPGQRFQVDGEDLGTELVYLIASLDPLPDVDAAVLSIARANTPVPAEQSPTFQALSGLAPGKASPDCKTRALVLVQDPAGGGCSRSRGLVLIGGADNVDAAAPPRASLVVRSDPGDRSIVKAFPWRHVSLAAYPEAITAYAAVTNDARQTRAVLAE